ncbi:MAG TPA: hypothetical protein VMZ90_09685 [Vicinamibacterales bacterium]|nr:hypothetical protein [Vicinamibacterales bacterium]
MRHFVLAVIMLASCVASATTNGSSKVLRSIPMVRVAASPEAFFGKRIRSTGFLAIEHGKLHVYLTRDAFLVGDNASAVVLKVPNKHALALAKRANRQYVEFSAMFAVAPETGDLRPPLGVFTDFTLIRLGESKERLNAPETNDLLLDAYEFERK